MPNWCYCKLIVQGGHKTLARFRDKARSAAIPRWGGVDRSAAPSDLNFHALYPVPVKVQLSGFSNDPGPTGAEMNGYDWCIEHWGTKWGGCDAMLEYESEPGDGGEGPGELDYSFNTAWSPPFAWLMKVSTDFPDLYFELHYEEPGMNYAGILALRGGLVVFHGEGGYLERHPEDAVAGDTDEADTGVHGIKDIA